MASRFVDVQGHRARYLEAGAGPPVLVIASMLIRAELYRPLLKTLAGRFRVVVLELPGSGRSSKIEGAWSIERCATFVRGFIELIALSLPVVIGHSNSAPVALAVGAMDVCGGVVAVDAVGVRKRGGLSRIVLARAFDSLFEPGLALRVWWHLPFNIVKHARSFFQQVWMARGTFAYELARRCRAPLLVAWGRRDHTMPLEDGRSLAAATPSAELVVGPGSHDWLVVKPRPFARAIEGFLSRHARFRT